MNASDVIAFLSGELPAREFRSKIEAEATNWAERLSERGRSAPITLIGMQDSVDLTPQRAGVLLDAYISGDLPDSSFAYVLDALLLEERFRWTSISVRDALEDVLGSDYPRRMDKRRAWQARSELKALSIS